MNRDDTCKFDPAYLAQWLNTARYYLFADQESLADGASTVSLASCPSTKSDIAQSSL